MKIEKVLDLENILLKEHLKTLLKDKTTKRNIVFATNSYEHFGFLSNNEITVDSISLINLQPRVIKSIESQKTRTKKRAEVFTPAWVCCRINNQIDNDWFGKENVFNILDGEKWQSQRGKIHFPENKNWMKYVNMRKLEITCGECPFVVSRYDTSSGEIIPIKKRIGFLDRKLRVINENVITEEEWIKWAIKAYKSCYGYEFQGDNLLVGRINLFLTFIEYFMAKWDKTPSKKDLQTISNIIIWNFFQMDGLNFTVPFSATEEQISLLDTENTKTPKKAMMYDWRQKKQIYFEELGKEN